MHLGVWLLVLVGGGVLWYVHRRDREALRRQRAGMFDGILPHLQHPELEQDGMGLPVLSGRYRDYDVKIVPVADHIGYRKLPSLWLLITVKGGIPYAGIFDYLVRPENIEFYSPAFGLSDSLPVPQDWPQHAILRSDRQDAMPPPARMAPHIRLFQDPKAKELLVTPRGVRIVYLANQAQRPHYLVLRSVTFEDLTIAPQLVCELLDAAIAVHQDLNEEVFHEANSRG